MERGAERPPAGSAAGATGTIADRTIRGLVATLRDDPQLAADFRATLVARRRQEMAKVVERGPARGDLRPGPHLAPVGELHVGPLFWRLLMTGDPLDEPFATAHEDLAPRTAAAAPPDAWAQVGAERGGVTPQSM